MFYVSEIVTGSGDSELSSLLSCMGHSFSCWQCLSFAIAALEEPGSEALVRETQTKKLKQIPYHRSPIGHGIPVLMGVEGVQKTSGMETKDCKRVIWI